MSINPDGTVTYTPNAGFTGTDDFTYTACDISGTCGTATVSVRVPVSALRPSDESEPYAADAKQSRRRYL